MKFYINIITIIGPSVDSFYYVLGSIQTHKLIKVMFILAFPSHGTMADYGAMKIIQHNFCINMKNTVIHYLDLYDGQMEVLKRESSYLACHSCYGCFNILTLDLKWRHICRSECFLCSFIKWYLQVSHSITDLKAILYVPSPILWISL